MIIHFDIGTVVVKRGAVGRGVVVLELDLNIGLSLKHRGRDRHDESNGNAKHSDENSVLFQNKTIKSIVI